MQLITTDFERSVLEMMAAGHTDSAIARRLNIGKRTFERQLADLMARVGAPSRLALGAIAAKRQWIDIDNVLTSRPLSVDHGLMVGLDGVSCPQPRDRRQTEVGSTPRR